MNLNGKKAVIVAALCGFFGRENGFSATCQHQD